MAVAVLDRVPLVGRKDTLYAMTYRVPTNRAPTHAKRIHFSKRICILPASED